MKFIKAIFILIFIIPFPHEAQAQQHSAALSWTASTSVGSTYNVYRMNAACPATPPTTTSGFTKLNTTPITGTSYIDTTITVGTWCYIATATLNGVESKPSNATPAVLLQSTAPPTLLRITALN